jgi:hypothetical protein
MFVVSFRCTRSCILWGTGRRGPMPEHEEPQNKNRQVHSSPGARSVITSCDELDSRDALEGAARPRPPVVVPSLLTSKHTASTEKSLICGICDIVAKTTILVEPGRVPAETPSLAGGPACLLAVRRSNALSTLPVCPSPFLPIIPHGGETSLCRPDPPNRPDAGYA